MARKKGTHHRRHHSSSSVPAKRHHRRHRMSDGAIMDGWVPSGDQLTHGVISGGMQQGFRLLASKFFIPLLTSVPDPYQFILAEIASGYATFAAARLLMKGAMQHDVQVGAVAIATSATTGLLFGPAISKALGISGYAAAGMNGYDRVGAGSARQPINGYSRAAINGGGQPAISSMLQEIPGRRKSGVGGYRSQYAVS